jgi:hypothetical protein
MVMRNGERVTCHRTCQDVSPHEPHTADITVLRQALEGVIKHEVHALQGVMGS